MVMGNGEQPYRLIASSVAWGAIQSDSEKISSKTELLNRMVAHLLRR